VREAPSAIVDGTPRDQTESDHAAVATVSGSIGIAEQLAPPPSVDERQRVNGLGRVVPVDENAPGATDGEVTRTAPQKPREATNTDPIDAVFLTLLASDDLSGAYWLAKSREADRKSTPFADWLLGCVQGARWLEDEQDPLVADLFEIASTHAPDGSEAIELVAVAASLWPVLVAPTAGLVDWLRTPATCPMLRPLVEATRAFASAGLGVHPDYLKGAAGEDLRHQQIASASLDASRWLKSAAQRTTKFGRGTEVLRRLVTIELKDLLAFVVADDRSRVGSVESKVGNWDSAEHASDRLDEVVRALHGARAEPIIGSPRQVILSAIAEACEHAKRWCSLSRREEAISARGTWLSEHLSELRREATTAVPAALTRLRELRLGAPPALAAAAACLSWSLRVFAERVHIAVPTGETEPPRVWSPLVSRVPGRNLGSALARRLLFVPSVMLDTVGLPTTDEMPRLWERLANEPAVGPHEVSRLVRARLELQDHRNCQELIELVSSPDEKRALLADVEEIRERSQVALVDGIGRVTALVEQAVLDGYFRETARAEALATLTGLSTDTISDIGDTSARLRRVEATINDARAARFNEQHVRWESAQRQLQVSSWFPADQRAAVKARVERALSAGDVRVTDELLSQVDQALAERQDVPRTWFEEPAPPTDFAEFIDTKTQTQLQRLNRDALRDFATKLHHRKTVPDVFAPPDDRVHEVAQSFDAWNELKRASGPECAQLVGKIVAYLGFDIDISGPTSTRMDKARAVEGALPNVSWVRLTMTAGDRSPVPQFGSLAGGQYRVGCVRERNGPEGLFALLRDSHAQSGPVLLFYLGRLTRDHRNTIGELTRERDLSTVVLDEHLLVFLARQEGSRLAAFLNCALPFSATHPYAPYKAGDVPSEMFYGRQEMENEIARPEASCIVYGGRQLGKSALLRHVQRRRHKPERQSFVATLDIKNIGDPNSGENTTVFWTRLRAALKEIGALRSTADTSKAPVLMNAVCEAVLKDVERRVLVLLDEADNFLDADAKAGFPIVTALRDAMSRTDRRFKVVFAGLHNVQRFQGIPNQPLAHFGTAIQVGPLEANSAFHLVTRPLASLGYGFAEQSVVLRILSYTNYHPGLIQLFCDALLKKLRQTVRPEALPYLIQQADVDAVYRQSDVREGIRERFEWTLALDARYQAVAWAVIVDQAASTDGYSKAYTPGEVLELARNWWRDGFVDLQSEDLRGILTEMCGLGILLRNTSGHYRLRSPNVVRLLSMGDVETRLLELSLRSRPLAFDADSHHPLLPGPDTHHSPFTHAQERQLAAEQYGVGLVFTAGATASEAIVDRAFDRLVRRDPSVADASGITEVAAIPEDVTTAHGLTEWLTEFANDRPRHQCMLVYMHVRGSVEQSPALVQAALHFCRSRPQGHKRWMRVLFVFNPMSAWTWLLSPGRSELENEVDTVVSTRRWNQIAIHQRLKHKEMYDHADRVPFLESTTGGWPVLLDAVFERASAKLDPQPEATALLDSLVKNQDGAGDEFLRRVGLTAVPLVGHVCGELSSYAPLTVKEIRAEAFSSPSMTVTQIELDAAMDWLDRFGCLERTRSAVDVERIVKSVVRGREQPEPSSSRMLDE
jgi:hypothetical protein